MAHAWPHVAMRIAKLLGSKISKQIAVPWPPPRLQLMPDSRHKATEVDDQCRQRKRSPKKPIVASASASTALSLAAASMLLHLHMQRGKDESQMKGLQIAVTYSLMQKRTISVLLIPSSVLIVRTPVVSKKSHKSVLASSRL